MGEKQPRLVVVVTKLMIKNNMRWSRISIFSTNALNISLSETSSSDSTTVITKLALLRKLEHSLLGRLTNHSFWFGLQFTIIDPAV